MTPDYMIYMRPVFALLFIVGLILLCAIAVKKTGLDKRILGHTRGKQRLSVLETLYLDPKRRLILVRCDSKEHLLLLSLSGDLLIHSQEKEASHVA